MHPSALTARDISEKSFHGATLNLESKMYNLRMVYQRTIASVSSRQESNECIFKPFFGCSELWLETSKS